MTTDHTSGMSPSDATSFGPPGNDLDPTFPLVSNTIFASHALDGASLERASDALLTSYHASTASASMPQQDRPPIDGITSGAVEFRVTRNGLPARRLRLTGRRYTFGNGRALP